MAIAPVGYSSSTSSPRPTPPTPELYYIVIYATKRSALKIQNQASSKVTTLGNSRLTLVHNSSRRQTVDHLEQTYLPYAICNVEPCWAGLTLRSGSRPSPKRSSSQGTYRPDERTESCLRSQAAPATKEASKVSTKVGHYFQERYLRSWTWKKNLSNITCVSCKLPHLVYIIFFYRPSHRRRRSRIFAPSF